LVAHSLRTPTSLQTGDFIGDPMPVYIVEFAPKELWGAPNPAARSSTPTCSRHTRRESHERPVRLSP
jgi:hypothetical protein